MARPFENWNILDMDVFVLSLNDFDKMVAICPDPKWSNFRISDHISSMDASDNHLTGA